ncbi:MAG: trypsin-like peptidase domain-containing protein [Planctomycetota bacterium]|nr:trypsin-like peptidase domain-containing protein [Planctomycetota bacterium]
MHEGELLRQVEVERRLWRLTCGALLLVVVLLGLSLAAAWRGPRLFAPPPVEPRVVTARGDLAQDELAQVELFERAAPSVVNVTNLAVRRDRWTLDLAQIPQGTGTGFVWDAAGHVVTNFHVIDGAHQVVVTLVDGTELAARVVGVFPDKDTAVLRVDPGAGRVLSPIALGTSSDLRVGQRVYAIGNPFGLDHTMTSGIVSALEREIQAANGRIIDGVIQSDAAINPGNSGGPLLDSAGRLIGMNTAILSQTGAYAGIGFAVPVDTVRHVVQQLIEHGRVLRPTLGVQLAADALARRAGLEGALVLDVVPGSPAARAGLRGTVRAGRQVRLGDLITAIDGKGVRRPDDLLNALERRQPGDTVRLAVQRDGQRLEVEVTLEAAR